MKLKTKVIAFIVLIIFILLIIGYFTKSLAMNTGTYTLNIYFVDENNNPIPNVKFNFTSTMAQIDSGINQTIYNEFDAYTDNNGIKTSDSNGYVKIFTKLYSITDSTTTETEEIIFTSIPSQYESSASKLKYKFDIDSTRFIFRNITVLEGSSLLKEEISNQTNVSGSNPNIFGTNQMTIKIKLDTKQETSNININIQDQEGNPVPGVGVKVTDQRSVVPVSNGYTGTTGIYTISNAPISTSALKVEMTSVPQGYTENVANGVAWPGWNIINGEVDPYTQGGCLKPTVTTNNGITTINIVWKALKVDPITLDCNVQTANIEGLGKIVSVVSDDESENTSVSVKDMVKYLTQNGKTITAIKDSKDNSVDLTSDNLVGTGYQIITNDGTYTAIVYGDVSGDGQINATDIDYIVNYFLGKITEQNDLLKKAGDVQKDGNLNAADISLMIKSFLGTLDGNILKES